VPQEWPLVGRVEELGFVLDTTRGPHSRGVVVAGALGVGKTRLVREASAALGPDFVVEWTAATPALASIPFGALAHLLPDRAVRSPPDRLRLLRGIMEALAERARGSPLVLAVDDAQWLDAGSAALVHQLVVTGAGRVLLTVRTGERAADPIVGLWKDGLVERLELQPLTPRDVDALVASALDRPVDRSTLGRFWALSRGNPLFVRELLLGALETDAFRVGDGVWSWTGGFGPSTRLSVILRDRLRRVSVKGRTVLDHLAVGEPLTVDTLSELCGTKGIAEVERAGLVIVDDGETGEARLCHPLYAEALRAAMTSVERRQVMVRLAETLEPAARSSRALLLRVAGWRLASATPAPTWLFTEAAEIANAVYDHVLAERLARRAVADGGGFRAALALGEALNRQGRCLEGLAVLEPLADGADSDEEHVAVAVARYFALTTEHGFRGEFEAVLLDAERQVQGHQLRAFLRAQRATLLCFAGRLDEGIDLVSAAEGDQPDEASQLRAVTALGAAWLCGGKPESACALGARMLEPALRHRDELPQAPAWVLSTQLPALVASGRLDEADAAVAFVETAAESGSASADSASFVALTRGMSALHRGLAETAHRCLRESVAGMRKIALWRLPFPLVYLVEACALTGNPDGATAASAEADLLVAHAAIFEGLARRARGWAALAMGQRSAAIERLLDAADWSSAHGQHTAELFALHDALRVGGGREAAPKLLALAPTVESRWATCFEAHAAAFIDNDAMGLEAVAMQFEEMGALLRAAEAFAQAGAAFRGSGLRSRAERATARARVHAAACEGARTPILDDVELPITLTAREREVAGMAAEGLSSSVIAERLFVSTRTVEGHLHRAYSKLGVGDRHSLSRLLKGTTSL
jgi:DNA-binding NarL/FixJ family response regulator